jgi:ethanolamine transporter EutH
VIRQGVRIGLTEQNASEVAGFLGMVDADRLKEAAQRAAQGGELSSDLRNTLGRFELAVDARIDAALTLAQARYVGATRGVASIVALLIALAVGLYLGADYIFRAVLVGVAAVPLAPVAKDLVTALQSATKAIRTKA